MQCVKAVSFKGTLCIRVRCFGLLRSVTTSSLRFLFMSSSDCRPSFLHVGAVGLPFLLVLCVLVLFLLLLFACRNIYIYIYICYINVYTYTYYNITVYIYIYICIYSISWYMILYCGACRPSFVGLPFSATAKDHV